MKYFRNLLGLLALLSLTACGYPWTHQCLKTKNYTLGDERSVSVGSNMVSSGCFKARWEHKRGGAPVNDENFIPIINKELIYSGRENNIVHIKYREYTGEGHARTAFYQELYYDVGKSDTIVFQEWVFKVIDSENSHIKFKVIQEPPPSTYQIYPVL